MDGTEFLFFKLIVMFLRTKIDGFVSTAYTDVMLAAKNISLVFLTLWVLNKGYQILAGLSRESMTDLSIQAGKMVVITLIFSSTQLFGIDIKNYITDFRDDLTKMVSATSGGANIYANVDASLADLNLNLNILDAVDSSGDPALTDAKSRSATLALIGQASPAMVGGTLSLLNEIAIGLGTIFAPIFIIALMFKQTSAMFFGWVKYMVTAMITMAVLSVMVQIAVDLSLAYLVAMTAVSLVIPTLQASMIQAGLGIILTVLLVTVPGMVATFFGTSMSHLEYNRFSSMQSNVDKTNQKASYDASQVPATPSRGKK